MQTIAITGRVGGEPETRDVGSNQVTNFNVAVDQGWGEKKRTNWYRCAIWGERGVKLSHHIAKGNKIAVTGELEVEEYNGKQSLNIRVNECDPFMQPKGEGGSPARQAQPAAQMQEPLDDDVPFATSSPEWEGRVS